VNHIRWSLHPTAYIAESWEEALKCAVCSFCKEDRTGHLGVGGLSRERVTVLGDTVLISRSQRPTLVAKTFLFHTGGTEREKEGGSCLDMDLRCIQEVTLSSDVHLHTQI